MLVAVILVAADISFILLVTVLVVSTSSLISLSLFLVSLLTTPDTIIILSKISFILLCSSLAELTASSLNRIVNLPTSNITTPISTIINVEHTASTSCPYIPFEACTAVTIMYKINIPAAVLFNDFFS